jgi:hypothetical protein
VGIITALAAVSIQQHAGNIGEVYFSGVNILQFVQATTATAITEGLPFIVIQLVEWESLPEEITHTGIMS